MTRPVGLRRFVPGQAQPGQAQPGQAPARGEPAAREPARGAPARGAYAAPEPGGQQPGPVAESCDMCSAEVPGWHGHVVDLERSALLCTCQACYLLFTHSQAGGGRYRAVPRRYLSDPGPPITKAEWEELEIPVGMAFFLHNSGREGIAGFYPSPAGATECRLDLAAWERVAAAHPLLAEAEPDVEAALVCRDGDRIEHFVIPVDACYELVGRMRLLWRGFDGGAEARQGIAEFLTGVRGQAKPARLASRGS